MSGTWGGPSEAPGIQRWGTLPLVFAAAGAAGGVADALASQALIGEYGREAGTCAWIGGGIGLGIGSALSLSRRGWIAVPLAPVLGGVGYVLSVFLSSYTRGDFGVPEPGELWRDLKRDEFFTLLAAIAAPVLVVAHLLWGRWSWIAGSLPRSLAFYALFGALSGSVFWYDMANGVERPRFWMGLLNGAIYGLFQYAAMRVARTMACGRGPRGEARTPSS